MPTPNRVSHLFRPLRTSEKHSALGISPNELDLFSVALVICLFIARTIKHAFGFGLPFVPVEANDGTDEKSGHADGQLYHLPDLSLHMPLRLGSGDKFRFAQAVEPNAALNSEGVVNNAQICLFLAAVSEPAMLLMLANQGCPIRPLGAVNVRNRFEILQPEVCQSLFMNPAKALPGNSQLSVLAKFPRPARRVRRGLEIDIEVSIVVGPKEHGTKVSTENSKSNQAASSAMFRQEFTMLQFMKFSSKVASSVSAKSDTQQQTQTSGATHETLLTVSMDGRAPLLWARLCKDYNPIHFSSILANMLGQPGQLAHGNHAVGICVQAMSNHVHGLSRSAFNGTGDAQTEDSMKHLVLENMERTTYGSKGWWMEVRFRRPIVLPAKIGPKLHDAGSGFDVVAGKTQKSSVEVSMGTI